MRNVCLPIVALLCGCYAGAPDGLVTPASAFADRLLLNDFEVVLEETVLEDVERRFGGTPHDSGDAGSSLRWLCYKLHGSNAYLELGSGELHGGTTITQFKLSALNEPQGCTPLDLTLEEVEIQHGLILGMRASELREKFGEAEQRGDTLSFMSVSDTTIAGPDGAMETFDVSRVLHVVIRNGRAVLIESHKATTS